MTSIQLRHTNQFFSSVKNDFNPLLFGSDQQDYNSYLDSKKRYKVSEVQDLTLDENIIGLVFLLSWLYWLMRTQGMKMTNEENECKHEKWRQTTLRT